MKTSMRKKLSFTFLCVLLVVSVLRFGTSQAQQGKDIRMRTISASELTQAVMQTPISSAVHGQLLSRAYKSQLSQLAYEQYTALWKRQPNNAFANLWRGRAALNLWYQNTLAGPSDPHRKEKADAAPELFVITRTSLANAYKLAPNSGVINMEEGFFLWQLDNDTTRGFKLLQKAVSLASSNPLVHARLGLVYMNPSGPNYDLFKAEQALQAAIRLDSTIAYLHQLMADIQLAKHDYRKAQSELHSFLELAPAQTMPTDWVKRTQAAIDAGLKK